MSLMPTDNRPEWMKFIDIFKTKNIFDDIGMQSPSPNLPAGGSQSVMTANTPDIDAIEQFRQALGSMPDRADYKPSIMQKIGAAISGIRPAGMWGGNPVGATGDPRISRELLDAPYERAVEDWKLKTSGLGDIARLEHQENVNARIGEGQERSAEIREEANRLRANRDEEIARHNQSTEAVARERLLRTLPEAESLALRAKYARELEEYRQSGRKTLREIDFDFDKELESIRQGNRMETEGTRQENRLELQREGEKNIRTRPNVAANKPPSASELISRKRNRAIEIINADPEAAEFFRSDINGTPTGVLIEPDDVGWFGWSQDKRSKYDRIQREMNDLVNQNPGPLDIPETDPISDAEKNLQPGEVLMMKPDGKTLVAVSESQSDAAIQAGYTRVKRAN